MNLMNESDDIFFNNTDLNLNITKKIISDALYGSDDGELF